MLFTFSTKIFAQDLHEGNYKILMNEVKEDLNKWKDNPCSWIGRLNMPVLPNIIYRFKAIPIKI